MQIVVLVIGMLFPSFLVLFVLSASITTTLAITMQQ